MLLATGPRGTQERRGIGCAFQHTGSLQVTDANAYLSPLEFVVPGVLVSLKGCMA